jgi:hypothetical protein
MNFRSSFTTFPLAALGHRRRPRSAPRDQRAPRARPSAAAAGNPWQVGLSIYGYLPTIGGTTSFPDRCPAIPARASMWMRSTILENLKMAFMGSLEHPQRAAGARSPMSLYVNVGATKSEVPATFHVAGFQRQPHGRPEPGCQAYRRGALAGRIPSWPNGRSGLHRRPAGRRAPAHRQELARLVIQRARPGHTPLEGRSGNDRRRRIRVWDAIVGVKGTYAFGSERQWFMPYYFDIGTGQSKLTYQVGGRRWLQVPMGRSGRRTWRYHGLRHEVRQDPSKVGLLQWPA